MRGRGVRQRFLQRRNVAEPAIGDDISSDSEPSVSQPRAAKRRRGGVVQRVSRNQADDDGDVGAAASQSRRGGVRERIGERLSTAVISKTYR